MSIQARILILSKHQIYAKEMLNKKKKTYSAFLREFMNTSAEIGMNQLQASATISTPRPED